MFINNIIDFLIVAFVIFIIVQQTTRVMKKPDPSTKNCPRCISGIPVKATKCPHCTADLAA